MRARSSLRHDTGEGVPGYVLGYYRCRLGWAQGTISGPPTYLNITSILGTIRIVGQHWDRGRGVCGGAAQRKRYVDLG